MRSIGIDPTLASRVGAGWLRLPRGLRTTILVVTIGGASFAATILPFIVADRGHSSVEIAGHVPAVATVRVPVSFDIAADNTGDGNIEPLCIRLTSQPAAVTRLRAVFQGLDHVEGSGDHVCGGGLSGSETVSVHVEFTPDTPGPITLRIVAMQGDRETGPARSTTMVVTGAR